MLETTLRDGTVVCTTVMREPLFAVVETTTPDGLEDAVTYTSNEVLALQTGETQEIEATIHRATVRLINAWNAAGRPEVDFRVGPHNHHIWGEGSVKP